VPEGKYLCGGIVLKSGVELYLDENAVILGSRNKADYTHAPGQALITARHARDIAVTGQGTMDGQARGPVDDAEFPETWNLGEEFSWGAGPNCRPALVRSKACWGNKCCGTA